MSIKPGLENNENGHLKEENLQGEWDISNMKNIKLSKRIESSLQFRRIIEARVHISS